MEQNQDTTSGKLLSLKHSAQSDNLLDNKAFDNLIHETSSDVVYDILVAFKDTLKECLGRLENPGLTPEEAYKVCHKLKGSALLIGFKPLGEACVKAMAVVKEPRASLPHPSIQETVRLAKATQSNVLKIV